MADKLNVQLPDNYTISPALEAAATTNEQKGFVRRIRAAKVEDMSFEVGKDDINASSLEVTEDEIKAWIEANRGKKFVIPEIRFAWADPEKIYNEDIVKVIEKKEGQADDYVAKYALLLLIKGLTEHTTGTKKTKISIPGCQVQAQ